MTKLLFTLSVVALIVSCSQNTDSGSGEAIESEVIQDEAKNASDEAGSYDSKNKKLTISGKEIWVRSIAKDGDVVMKLNTGDKVNVLDSCCYEEIKGNASYWYKIEFESKTVWFFGSQTEEFGNTNNNNEETSKAYSITKPKLLNSKIKADKSLVVFNGLGTEPFWDIYLTKKEVLYVLNEEYKSYQLLTPFKCSASSQTIKYKDVNGKTKEAKIEKKPSGDGMSERTYPYSIILDEGDHKLYGVGYIDKSTIISGPE